jgi:hypothetical protein
MKQIDAVTRMATNLIIINGIAFADSSEEAENAVLMRTSKNGDQLGEGI